MAVGDRADCGLGKNVQLQERLPEGSRPFPKRPFRFRQHQLCGPDISPTGHLFLVEPVTIRKEQLLATCMPMPGWWDVVPRVLKGTGGVTGDESRVSVAHSTVLP